VKSLLQLQQDACKKMGIDWYEWVAARDAHGKPGGKSSRVIRIKFSIVRWIYEHSGGGEAGGYSLPELANGLFQNTDHSTVRYMIERARDRGWGGPVSRPHCSQ